MTPNSASYLPGTPGGQPMTPGTGGLDMMSPVIGLYYSFQHGLCFYFLCTSMIEFFSSFILNKIFFTKIFIEFLLQIES